MADDDRQLSLPKREEEILAFWEQNKIFKKTLAKTKRGKPFVFYEGPPTANGSPGIHHFEARAFKDVIPRYKTMRGYYVERKAGWDTHGLPVEIQAEKELGLKSKQDIEKFGIAKFNATCRESVWRYKEEWDRFTRRIGFWLDLDHPYITYEPSYIETLWWIISEAWKKKLLYRDFKVVPWCTRCQTGLSTHELGLGYGTVKDRSLYVRFRVVSDDPRWRDTSILSWTTTPWTLPGNVALAVNPKEDYVCIPDPETKRRWLILGQKPFREMVERSRFPAEYRSSLMLDDIDTFKGRELVGLAYEPPFAVAELSSPKSHRVYPADFVAAAEGTGVVHTAVMYGEDDYRLGKGIGLPTFHTVDETGRFINQLDEGLGGCYVKDPKTEEAIIKSLKRRRLFFAEEAYEHEYPSCWRCATPLLYYAREGWWITMSALKERLVAANEQINWVPSHIKRGRFGEFLRDVRDWAFSRERFWGTPLPIWRCVSCPSVRVAGALADLDRYDPAPTTLVIMRHGEALHNVRGRINPVSPAADRRDTLTERGRRQALATARTLKRAGIEAIVASPSLRAQETATIVAREIGIAHITTLPDLKDLMVGALEHRPIAEFGREFSSFDERFTKKPKGAENLRELRVRMMRAVMAIRTTFAGKGVLVVTHGDPSWVLMAALESLAERDYEEASYLKPAECRKVRLHNWPYDASGELNLHRPYVDGIELSCEACGGLMRREPAVADVWFDSGAMPFAQHHYPFAFMQNQRRKTNDQKPRALPYPADYISEAIDQTRGWFYTLLAVATILGRPTPYRNVISLGHVLDKDGQKMSKSKGNVVDPWAMIGRYGTDAIRWYFYTVNAPGESKRFDEQEILLRLRGALSTFWNSFVFFDTYVDKIRNPKSETRSKSQTQNFKHVLDQWVMARLDELTREITRRLDGYDIAGAARMLDQFIVEDFSNWYIRRSRRRFQRPVSAAEGEEAAVAVGSALLRLAELMAPFTPFLAEAIYQELKPKLGLIEESVHLQSWPKAGSRKQEARMLDGMADVRRLAALGLAERAKAGRKVRQPLGKLKVKRLKLKVPALLDLLKGEVNVKEVVVDSAISGEVELDTAITPELREEGMVREIVRNIQEMRRDAGLRPQQGIRVQVAGDRAVEAVVERWRAIIQNETGARAVAIGGKNDSMVARETELGGRKLWVGIQGA